MDQRKITVGNLIDEIDRLNNDLDEFTYNSGEYPPGHFYSPINDHDFLKSREDEIWKNGDKPEVIEDIELNTDKQLELLKSFSQYYPEIPFKCKKQPDL